VRLDDFQPSDNVEDRRDQSSGGGGGGFNVRPGHIGIGGIAVVLVLSYVTGINPLTLLGAYNEASNIGGGQAPSQSGAPQGPPRQDASEVFVAKVLRATEETWTGLFQTQENGRRYEAPKLVLFRGETASGCGAAQAAMGPFYCPNDRKVYLDTAFFDEMRSRFHACPETEGACAFSEAYVIAHEVGHHVQNLLGILPKVHQAEERAHSEAEANHYSVDLELQADCLAGVWAANTREKLNLQPGDVQAALQTANAIGDDTLQRAARGRVVPDSFTHGTSAQREHWFTTGLNSGQVNACNTFQ
jgi:predicted metalloprotease